MSIRQLVKVLPASVAAVLLISCSGVSPAPVVPASNPPTVLLVVPQTNGVGTNREIAVVFSKPMSPPSINASTFLVAGVAGTVTYDVTNKIAAFKSTNDFAANATYNASITTGAMDLNGTALAAPFNFSFTTRATADTSPPEIVLVSVAAGATCVPLDTKIQVTFDESMDSLTINPSTFFIVGVSGSVTYDASTLTATFTPAANLAANTTYTIEVTTGVKDMGEVPLAKPLQQTFTTGPCQSGIPPVSLCPGMGNIAVLAGSTVTNTGSTTVAGDVALSPGTSVTGFPPGQVTGAGTIHIADAAAADAQITLTAAFNDAAGRSGGTTVAGDIGGQTFTSGVYKSTSSLAITSGDVTIDAQGNPAAVFIFQIASTLITASGSHVVLTNGANACNIFWQVGSSATLGTNSVFKGIIMADQSITITTGATLEGRALARIGAVTLDSNSITGCTCGP
jgi:hypothetical protein